MCSIENCNIGLIYCRCDINRFRAHANETSAVMAGSRGGTGVENRRDLQPRQLLYYEVSNRRRLKICQSAHLPGRPLYRSTPQGRKHTNVLRRQPVSEMIQFRESRQNIAFHVGK